MSKKNRWKQNPALASANWHALARQQGEPLPPSSPIANVSDAQLAANRANSLLSTGPRTEAGLAKSSKNAIKSALTGRTVVLPSDDLEEYAAFLADFQNDLKPIGTQERELLQTIVDSHWRLRRIQELEYAIYVRGERQFAEQFQGEPAETRRSMIVLETHLAYQKELRNLHIQEARIDRKRKQALAELKELQKERQQPAAESAEKNYGFSSEKELFAAMDAGFVPPRRGTYRAAGRTVDRKGLAGASTPDSSTEFAGRARAVAEPVKNGFDFSNSASDVTETTESHSAAA